MRDKFPSPIDKATALFLEKPWISRNWKSVAFSDAANWGDTSAHVLPALVVRRTVPVVPDTHKTLSFTGERPRNCCVLFVDVSVHDGKLGDFGCANAIEAIESKMASVFMMQPKTKKSAAIIAKTRR
jgi:hypothetical protein